MEENNSQPNKYNAALAQYNTNLSDADIQARVAELIEKKVPENNTEAAKWLTKNELDSVAWLPADITLIGKIKECMSI